MKEWKLKWQRMRGLPAPDRFLYLEDGAGGFDSRAWRSAYVQISNPTVALDEAHLVKLLRLYLDKLEMYSWEENAALLTMGFREFWWLVETGIPWEDVEGE